jgi:type IV pilus assembly protein PilE
MNVSAQGQLRRGSRGFTLIELMIVVAVVAILAAVALPSYSDYIRRGKLPDAFTYLSDYKVKMEQYYQDNRNYGVAACADTNSPLWSNFVPNRNPAYFTFGCQLVTVGGVAGQGYTLTATSNASLSTAHVYTLDYTNTKGTTTFKGATVTGKTCWLVNGSEC